MDQVEDMLSDLASLAESTAATEDTTPSVFQRGFELAKLHERLARAYVIKAKKVDALMIFGPLLLRRKVQLNLFNKFLALLKKGGPVRIIVLKSRKLGVTTATDVLLLELAMQIPNWQSVIIAHTKDAAKELFQFVRQNVERMQARNQCPDVRANNETTIRFGTRNIDARNAGDQGMGSAIQAATAGGSYVLSGQTPNGLHMSECAKYDAVGGDAEQERFILSALGAVPKVGASFVVAESTANGQQGWFYKTWKAAIASQKDEDGLGWVPIFIAWWQDPDCRKPVPSGYNWAQWPAEDIAREKKLVEKYQCTPDQLYFRRAVLKSDMNMNFDYWDQEFPDSWETAFIASGNGIFDRATMDRLRGQAEDEKYRADTFHGEKGLELREVPGGSVRVWKDPEPDTEYILGADVADGVTFGVDSVGRPVSDASTFAIYKRGPLEMEQVAECVSYADNFEFGRAIAEWGRHYNTALVNVERNRAQGVIAGLRVAEYPTDRMFRPPLSAAVSEAMSGSYFFQKTASNSKNLMDTLYSWSRDRLIVRSRALIEELSTLRRDVDGRIETNGKDQTIATAMAVIADAQGPPLQMVAAPAAQRPPAPAWNQDAPEPEPDKSTLPTFDGDTSAPVLPDFFH